MMNRLKLSEMPGGSQESRPGQEEGYGELAGYGIGGGRDDEIDIKVSQLTTDVDYIRHDAAEIKSDVKAMDSRLIKIETGISAVKSALKSSAAVVSIGFALCACVFGSYVLKILDALNGLVLR
nr:hemolysin XhlA [Erwinia sp. Ejp617]